MCDFAIRDLSFNLQTTFVGTSVKANQMLVCRGLRVRDPEELQVDKIRWR